MTRAWPTVQPPYGAASSISNFPFMLGSKPKPKFSLLSPFLPPDLFCASSQLPPLPAPNPTLPSAQQGWSLAALVWAECVPCSFSGRLPICQEPNCSPGKKQGAGSNEEFACLDAAMSPSASACDLGPFPGLSLWEFSGSSGSW